MNAERLHVIALALRSELTESKIVESLQQIRDSLERWVQNPQQAQFQQQVSQTLQGVQQQATQLHDLQLRAWEHKLAEERQRWELDRLRQEATNERAISLTLAQKADELVSSESNRAADHAIQRQISRHRR